MFCCFEFYDVTGFSGQDFVLETVMRSYSQRLDCLELNPYVFFMKVIFIVFMFRDVPECSVFLVLSTPLSSDLYLPSTVTERFLTVPITSSQLVLVPSLTERTRKVDWR